MRKFKLEELMIDNYETFFYFTFCLKNMIDKDSLLKEVCVANNVVILKLKLCNSLYNTNEFFDEFVKFFSVCIHCLKARESILNLSKVGLKNFCSLLFNFIRYKMSINLELWLKGGIKNIPIKKIFIKRSILYNMFTD